MTKYLLDSCCFVVDLRIGSFIIGYFNLIACTIETIISIIVVSGGVGTAANTDENNQPIGATLLILGTITLVIVAILLAFTIVLLIGLHKNKPDLLKAYLIYSCIFVLISLTLFVVNLIIGPYKASVIANRILSLLLVMYFVMVIRSYYYKMLKRSTRPPNCNASE